MKELTKEEKAKAYDEAIELIKKCDTDKYGCVIGIKPSDIFPSLKESEDEKIRKVLRERIIRYDPNNEILIKEEGISQKQFLAWLEKQGGQKPAVDTKVIIPKFRVGDIVKSKSQPMLRPRKIVSIGKNCYWCEDRGCIGFAWEDDFEIVEQKPTDKVNPKHKVGDWVICKNGSHRVFQVIERSWPNAKYLDEKGAGGMLNVATLDKQYRPWTIQDAKDGDVLACNNGWICIFKTLVNDETFSSYCFMDNTKWFCETGSECHTLKEEFVEAYNGKIYPATKEQRDTLERAMADAEYTFDFEKKELKKIKQKPDTDFSDLRTWKYIVDAVWTEKEGIGQYLDSPFTEEVAKKLQKRFGNIEQKHSWSEEDKKDGGHL